MNVLWIHHLSWIKTCLNWKGKNCMNFEFYNSLIILMWWQYFCFLNVCLNSAYVSWICGSWMLALERMMKKEKCYWGSEKSLKWFLKQKKAVNTKKYIRKKKEKKKKIRKKKEKERNKVVIQGKKSVLKNPGHL